ncbi:MAG TPA: SIS domain-containing protein [Terriglobia bacterium]|nr:SIS domain-containing protein [Terriglobia bacterium]
MNIRNEIAEVPGALRRMQEEGRPLYDALIRRISWGERPIYILGDEACYPAALAGAWAFESFLGMPVIVQRAAVFNAYTSRTLARRSLVIVVAGPEVTEETLAACKRARSQGAKVWAVTAEPPGELAALADATVNDYSGGPAGDGPRSLICRHAALLFLAMAAARVLKSPGQARGSLEEELDQLPRHIEWVLNQISDAARALATAAANLPELDVAGGGAFYPVALEAAGALRQPGGPRLRGFEVLEFQQSRSQVLQPGAGVLYLSSSRCGLKTEVHRSVRELRQEGRQKIFALTDADDRALSERADMAVLLPVVPEAAGALLCLAFLQLAGSFAGQASPRKRARRARLAGPEAL